MKAGDIGTVCSACRPVPSAAHIGVSSASLWAFIYPTIPSSTIANKIIGISRARGNKDARVSSYSARSIKANILVVYSFVVVQNSLMAATRGPSGIRLRVVVNLGRASLIHAYASEGRSP